MCVWPSLQALVKAKSVVHYVLVLRSSAFSGKGAILLNEVWKKEREKEKKFQERNHVNAF
jgi:hypothetical protein